MRLAAWAVLCVVCLASDHVVLGVLGLLVLFAAHGGSADVRPVTTARIRSILPPA
ncbi:hypothetical protein ACIRSS_24275 [Amycolatopsis sp. NPDC101161]|uniref:hypothetical protein n=1 Tax=Amycolatopsis sp. NPDC101161 TaxID=3363940 RepID=UPI0037FB7C12